MSSFSGACSAINLFSRLFPVSSSFRRLVPGTLIPAGLAAPQVARGLAEAVLPA